MTHRKSCSRMITALMKESIKLGTRTNVGSKVYRPAQETEQLHHPKYPLEPPCIFRRTNIPDTNASLTPVDPNGTSVNSKHKAIIVLPPIREEGIVMANGSNSISPCRTYERTIFSSPKPGDKLEPPSVYPLKQMDLACQQCERQCGHENMIPVHVAVMRPA